MSDTWRPIRYAIAHNKKLARAGGPAAWLYVGGLLYAHQHATDGHLDEAVIGSLVAGYTTRETTKATSALLACGLWEPDVDGFYIHDWDDENDPAERLKARRAGNRDRQAAKRVRDRNGVTSQPDVNVTNMHDAAVTLSRVRSRREEEKR